ncbi:MAG: carbonic anhydrase [bacterium]|nr:carbonic anhydrase [bacterium]
MIQQKKWQVFFSHLVIITALLAGTAFAGMGHIAPNVATDFSRTVSSPHIAATTFVHPLASVIGNVTLEGQIMVSPGASVRGDEGQPIFVGEAANIQDGVVLHGLETEELSKEHGDWEFKAGRQFNAQGERVGDGSGYSVYIGERVSLAHQAQVHGPAYVGHDTFIAMQSLIFNAKVGSHCVIEPGCTIVGVELPDHVYVPAGTTITSQSEVAEKTYPIYEGYTYEHTNEAVVHVNESLAEGYLETCDGDLNGDGEITPQDALLVFLCYLERGACSACADVNHDGEITPQDALCLFSKFLGRSSCLD